jgi:hypothetical protein
VLKEPKVLRELKVPQQVLKVLKAVKEFQELKEPKELQ